MFEMDCALAELKTVVKKQREEHSAQKNQKNFCFFSPQTNVDAAAAHHQQSHQ